MYQIINFTEVRDETDFADEKLKFFQLFAFEGVLSGC